MVHTIGTITGNHFDPQRTFIMESANFMTQDTSRPLNAMLATTISVTVSYPLNT